MVFPTAGEQKPRSQAQHADQQPPGIAQSRDQSTLCLQTTAEPNLAQIFPRQRKGLPFGAAALAPGLGSWLCHEQPMKLQASCAAARSLGLSLSAPGSLGRPPSRGRQHSGWRDGQGGGDIPAGTMESRTWATNLGYEPGLPRPTPEGQVCPRSLE